MTIGHLNETFSFLCDSGKSCQWIVEADRARVRSPEVVWLAILFRAGIGTKTRAAREETVICGARARARARS